MKMHDREETLLRREGNARQRRKNTQKRRKMHGREEKYRQRAKTTQKRTKMHGKKGNHSEKKENAQQRAKMHVREEILLDREGKRSAQKENYSAEHECACQRSIILVCQCTYEL